MADEPETAGAPGADSSAGAEESSSSPAEKPARRRGRAASAKGAADAAAVEKPKRTRAAAKEAAAEEAPKPRRARAAAKKVEEGLPGRRRSLAASCRCQAGGRGNRCRGGAEAAAGLALAQPSPRGTVEAPAPLAGAEAGSRRREAAQVPGRRTARPPVAAAVGQPPLVHAKARYVRSSARKARIVCDHIRGKSVPEARAILAFAPRGVAKDWSKLLDSAVANAEHNHELIGDELRIKEVFADVGPTLKRFRPRAMGRATPINKRTAHLSITLTPKE